MARERKPGSSSSMSSSKSSGRRLILIILIAISTILSILASNKNTGMLLQEIKAKTRVELNDTDWQQLASNKREVTCAFNDTFNVTPPIVPSFIIVGAQKAGTTALYKILKSIPGILATKRVEAHFFDYRINQISQLTPEGQCRVYSEYTQQFDLKRLHSLRSKNQTTGSSKNIITFEKTPAYLALPLIPETIVKLLPQKPKIIVVLRDPIARAYSHFKMDFQTSEVAKRRRRLRSFDSLVSMEILKMIEKKWIHAPPYANLQPSKFQNRSRRRLSDDSNNTTGSETQWDPALFSMVDPPPPKNSSNYLGFVRRGCYYEQLLHWLRQFELDKTIKVVQYERFEQNKVEILEEILDFVGVDDSTSAANRTLKRLEKDYSPHQKSPTQKFPPLTNRTKAYLKAFYRPYNDALADLLGENWRGVWD
jgi:hypothetical protein